MSIALAECSAASAARSSICAALLAGTLVATAQVDTQWEGYPRLSREDVLATVANTGSSARAELYAKNLSDLDLTSVDFRGANLSASVLNGAKLMQARLDGCNLTVSFLERADLSGASIRKATLFSVQLAGGNLTGADLSGSRLIGDLNRTNLSKAALTRMDAAPDMKNQPMGLMRTRITNATAIEADFSDSDFSRTDFSFTDFTRAKLLRTKLYRADLSGAVLREADLSGADLRDAVLIDVDFAGANLSDADLTGANFRGVRGLESAITTGTRGLP